MDIQSVSTQAAGPSSGAATLSGQTSDFQTFLTLLTAQLRNQDPLKPLESTDFVAQLASFSAVEQQVRANEKLDEIVALLEEGGTDGLASMVGTVVRAPVGSLWSGEPIDVTWDNSSGSAETLIRVYDSTGSLIDQRPLSGNPGQYSWDGPPGGGAARIVRFEIVDNPGLADQSSKPGMVAAEILELRFGTDGAEFVFADGSVLPATDVLGLG
jgi:flagellar basal-body rod modification protein FlgD